jgi:hypothetical protein
MRRLNLFAVFVLLMLTMKAVAQVNVPKKHPLIVIDGVIFKGNIENIDPNSIAETAVLKGPVAKKMYGDQAADGAILIVTKRDRKPDSIRNALLNDPALANERLIIVDGELSEKKLNEIDTSTVFLIDSIKREKAFSQFQGRARNGVVSILTKTAAIKVYENKLAGWSPGYQIYLGELGDDTKVIYILNGQRVSSNQALRTKVLFNLDNKKIKSVNFNNGERVKKGAKPVLIIKTK